jgi:dienelactone hydrolase
LSSIPHITDCRRGRTGAALLLVALLLQACTAHEHQAYNPSRPEGSYTMAASQGSGYYDYRAPTPQAQTYPLPFQQVEGYAVSGIRFSSSERNGQPGNLVDARYFRSYASGRKPLLIVMPIWATHTFPSTVISNGYALHSEGEANILWMQGDGALFDWFEIADIESEQEFHQAVTEAAERFRAVAIDVRRLIDWAETRPEIDTSRIGLIGFSMSALVGANVAGNDPRINTAVYVLGGARPGDMMADCNLVVQYMREEVSETLGWTQQQYREYFQEQLTYGDPARWQGHYRPENTLIIESGKDDCIPAASRASLFTATGEPERILYPYNHWQPFLSMTPVGRNVLTRDIYEFLDRKLLQNRKDSPQGSHRTTSSATTR